MSSHNLSELGQPATMASLRERFGKCDWWAWFEETESLNDDAPTIRLIDGPIEIDGDPRRTGSSKSRRPHISR